jgi:hypothetical protein
MRVLNRHTNGDHINSTINITNGTAFQASMDHVYFGIMPKQSEKTVFAGNQHLRAYSGGGRTPIPI